MAIAITSQGLDINGTVHPLHSGSIHYWRHDHDTWPLLLGRIREMGFRFITTCIPWSVHETAPGSFDFGKTDPKKDIAAFLKLCKNKEIFVLAKPGPNVGAEITYYGYPKRILSRDDIMARTSDGAPAMVAAAPAMFPAPSYASDAFYEETASWFNAICPILDAGIYPRGPVVGIQPDNALSFFGRTQPFDVDYSTAALKLYHGFLRQRHRDIETLNKRYAAGHTRFRDIMPPREFAPASLAELPYYFDWVEFKEFLVYHGIKTVADMLRERGLRDVFFFHNHPSYPAPPFHVPGAESAAVDVAGVDISPGPGGYESMRDTARYLAACSRLAFVPNLAAGGSVLGRPFIRRDQEFAGRVLLMHGIKAMNHHMLVDRDRWCGAPVARDGRRRTGRFNFYTALNGFLEETQFHKNRLHAEALLLQVRDYERFECMTSLMSPLPREAAAPLPHDWFCRHAPIKDLDMSPLGPYRRQWRGFIMGFRQAGYSLLLGDSDLPAEALQQYKLIIAPSFSFMSAGLQRRLLVYALKGGVLVMGPRVPVMDEFMRSETRFSSHLLEPVGAADEFDYNGMLVQHAQFFKANKPLMESRGKICGYERSMERGAIIFLGCVFPDYTGIEQAPHLAELARRLAVRAGLERPFPADDPLVETAYHTGGGRDVLFVSNPTDEKRMPRVAVGPGRVLTDWRSREQHKGRDVEIALPPRSIRVFLVENASDRKA